MPDIRIKYPSTSTVTMAIALASLNTNGSQGSFVFGRESSAVNNTTNNDLDHLLSGSFTVGSTAPTAGRNINVYVYAPLSMSGGTPTYAGGLDGVDSDLTFTSANVQNSILRLAASITVDNAANRVYAFAPVSVASLFGGVLPPFWGAFVAHDTAVAFGTNHDLFYYRVQGQTV